MAFEVGQKVRWVKSFLQNVAQDHRDRTYVYDRPGTDLGYGWFKDARGPKYGEFIIKFKNLEAVEYNDGVDNWV